MSGECPCFRPEGIAGSAQTFVIDLSLQACSDITLKNVAVLGECCPPGRDSSLNLIVLVFASDAVSLSQADVAFNVVDLSVVDIILVCRFPESNLFWICSSSDPGLHFHPLIPVACVVFYVVY